ncbi:MAG: ROK family protein [Lachnospiraceae bacterium]|nr:ROK family protein [Lachnospiraceae bacterium]
MSRYILGIDLGGTTAKLGLLSEEGRLFEKWEIPTRIENFGKNILPDLAKEIERSMAENFLTRDDILGVGLAVPGAVMGETEVAKCVNLNGWGGSVAEDFSKLINLPVKVINDANAAALGEAWQGGGKGYQNLVFVTLGTGVGGGIILNGKLLTGSHGAAGEIGHMKIYPEYMEAGVAGGDFSCGTTVDALPITAAKTLGTAECPASFVGFGETEKCGCGKKGCTEQYASATGIVRTARAMGMTDADSKFGFLSAKDVFDKAKDGNKTALAVAHKFAEDLGRALAGVSAIVDPEIFVIGGGVSKAGPFIIDMVQPYFLKYAFPACEGTEFALAKLENDAGFYGAAKLILQ